MGRPPRTTSRRGRATISDVATLAGVSPTAVSKVFNDTGRISEATAARIREAAAKLNWTPSTQAVALRLSRARAVGLVLNRPGAFEIGVTSSLLISGVETVLAPLGYGLLLYLVDREPGDETQTYRTLADERRVDGVILTDSRVGDSRFALMRDLGLPAVLIGTPDGADPIPHLDAEPPGAGVDDAVAHLLELGHRRIAYVGGPADRVAARDRRRMFEATMAAAGVPPVASIAAEYGPSAAAVHTTTLLGSPLRPTAIIYGSDPMAIAGVTTAHKLGVRVPADLSVVGYDGLPISEWVDPTLTTVQRDAVERGRAVATRLLTLLGEDVEHVDLARPRLIVRGSTGPAPAEAS